VKEEYELHADGEVLATLRWRRLWGSLAEASAAEGHWTFKRTGFWQPRGTVRVAGSEDDLGTFEARWTGNGLLTLATGERYQWQSANVWGTRYEWLDERGEELVRFSSTSLLKAEAEVDVQAAGGFLDTLPLLVLYGWYLLVMQIRDTATAGVGVG
jgi:hypothetical protein